MKQRVSSNALTRVKKFFPNVEKIYDVLGPSSVQDCIYWVAMISD